MLSLSSGLPLLYGDALLVQGPRKSFPLLAKDTDFIMLSEHREKPRLSIRSLYSVLALLILMFVPVLSGMPPHEVAFFAAALVILTGAISMEQVYREIDWRIVFLLALMIPLGHAVEHVAANSSILPILKGIGGSISPEILVGIFLVLGSAISQTIDNSVAVIFLGPIALELAQYTRVEPTLFLTAVTLGSSISFMLPTSCRSNLLVTGAGGYKARDFLRVGVPFSLVVGAAVWLMLIIPA
jgi:di/tricarboxylate transporter